MADQTVKDVLLEKLKQYADPADAKRWFEDHYQLIKELFTSNRLLEFVFEPIRDVFALQGHSLEDDIRAAITRVAVVNAVLAGLPGKMGIGVFVVMALEAWMAYAIAIRVGIRIDKPSDVLKYFSLLAGVGVTIVWGFKQLLGFFFSLLGPIMGPVNPLIPAELLATNLVGVLFWFGFDEVKRTGSFQVPKRSLGTVWSETTGLFNFQWGIIKNCLSIDNLTTMGRRVLAWFRGEIHQDQAMVRGDILATVAMAYLICGKVDRLEGPLGKEFMGAIRDRYPDLADASDIQIAETMASYDGDQIVGVINLIKGKLFERLETKFENTDGDEWSAFMHKDESFPGSDITFVNDETGVIYEVSLKATDNPPYIEEALRRYPDIPIMTTEEVAAAFPENPNVFPGHYANGDLHEVTQDNFDRLVADLTPIDQFDVATAGPVLMVGVGLWPFVVAYLSKRISYQQLELAFTKVLGEAGKVLVSRISWALIFGPLFAWYLLARGTIAVVRSGEAAPVRRLAWSPRPGHAVAG